MGRPPKKKPKDKPERADRRRMTSFYINPDIMAALKKAAIDERRTAYEIVEDAISAYLKKTRRP
jgi:Ribbon-helix-helix protein, copG family